MSMSGLRIFYLGTAVIGTIVPMSYLSRWIIENGFSMSGLVDAWCANLASTGLAWELVIAAVALIVWIWSEAYVRKDYGVAVLCTVATSFVGLSSGLPLYLFLRTRKMT